MKLDEALADARRRIAAAEARLLLGHCLGLDLAWLTAHGDEVIGPAMESAYFALVDRRASGEPMAYVIGHREFFGREFEVSPAVLIPRPETELLVELGLNAVRDRAAPRVLDIGTGSGCIAVTLALECPQARVTAVDVSLPALELARRNASQFGAAVEFHASDWFSALAGRCFDLIVANPPYVAAGDAHLCQGDLRFEPPGALASGEEGLDAIRHILAQAPHHLDPGGRVLLEHGYDQAESVRGLLVSHAYGDIEQHRDLAGIVRVSGGRLA